MLVRIVKRTFSGAEYCPEQKVLKLGGEGSTGVETLEFELPEEWAGMAVTVHVQQLDGTLPQPVLLGEDRCLEVDRMFTASEKGLWMLRAMDGNGYCAMTRPARYECYETFATDGDTEITPSQYEAFVAQVLGAANTASQKAKDAQSAADRAEGAAGEAQKAKAAAADSTQQAKGEAESAQTAAQQADKAAARAEGYAPKDGTVLSVNGKGGGAQSAIRRLRSRFLSTPSARRATGVKQATAKAAEISIHALREEGDMYPAAFYDDAAYFYPRPPRGGRRFPYHIVEGIKKFLSTPSARRATVQILDAALNRRNFYPRPPRGGRQLFHIAYYYSYKFLSTPSARRATTSGKRKDKKVDKFLSTPSARRATTADLKRRQTVRISIHALREEGD